jgi:hypothetical protein
MAAPALKIDTDIAPPRRFQLPDLDRHGRWLLDRMLKVFPHRTERNLIGWLRGILYSNEFLFLYQEHGVALATVMQAHPLSPKMYVQEIFVLSEPGFELLAAGFYDEFAMWAKRQGLDTIVVEEMSDVPHEAIKERLGRLFQRTVNFARL